MKNSKATIYDVAKKAGVSPATVSRVLNGTTKVSPISRSAVIAAIKELNFIPKAEAVANARKQYRKIGVIAPFFTETSYMQRLRGITSVLSAMHYEVVIYAVDEIDDLNSYLEMLVSGKRVDGLIALCMRFNDAELTVLREAPFPVCFVENEEEGFDSVTVKNLEGGQKAAEYLFSKGYRKPGFIGEKTSMEYAIAATEDRFTGFSFFFANQGITIPDNHVWIGEFTENKLDKAINDFLKQKDLPDCVFCSSDLIAARFIKLAKNIKINVPEQMAVLGFDDIDISHYIGLSSISQNLDESGRLAAEMVLSHIKEPTRIARKALVPITVIERETTGSC
ncbi:MAG: LacI family transcriptional regulator [Treponema sp. CETP13]|nr:MAG: LacI family transcriptional regulator [Treponema sp. CETP13]